MSVARRPADRTRASPAARTTTGLRSSRGRARWPRGAWGWRRGSSSAYCSASPTRAYLPVSPRQLPVVLETDFSSCPACPNAGERLEKALVKPRKGGGSVTICSRFLHRSGMTMKLAALLATALLSASLSTVSAFDEDPFECVCISSFEDKCDRGCSGCDFVITFPTYTSAPCFPIPYCEPAGIPCTMTFAELSYQLWRCHPRQAGVRHSGGVLWHEAGDTDSCPTSPLEWSGVGMECAGSCTPL